MDNPSKITEGDNEYSLGKFDGTCVHYDFPKILKYLDAKGKLQKSVIVYHPGRIKVNHLGRVKVNHFSRSKVSH